MSIYYSDGVTEEGIEYNVCECTTCYHIGNKEQHYLICDKLNKQIEDSIKTQTGDDVRMKIFKVEPDTTYPTSVICETEFCNDIIENYIYNESSIADTIKTLREQLLQEVNFDSLEINVGMYEFCKTDDGRSIGINAVHLDKETIEKRCGLSIEQIGEEILENEFYSYSIFANGECIDVSGTYLEFGCKEFNEELPESLLIVLAKTWKELEPERIKNKQVNMCLD